MAMTDNAGNRIRFRKQQFKRRLGCYFLTARNADAAAGNVPYPDRDLLIVQLNLRLDP